jgi:tetratricopeptide (TPR) repeat protein
MAQDAAQALLNEALQAMAQRQWSAALATLNQALALAPDDAALHINLSWVLDAMGDLPTALEHLCDALDLAPELPEVHLHLGTVLARLGSVGMAEQAYRQALQRAPELVAAWCNLGSLLDHIGRGAEAERCLRHALALDAHNASTLFNLACLLLREGRLQIGWQVWEQRHWPIHHAHNWPCPRWRGEPLQDKHMLVVQDAGLGDMLQFSRFIPLLGARGAAHTAVLCQPPLHPLMAQLPGVHAVYRWQDAEPALQARAWDYWVPVMSLAAYLGNEAQPYGPTPPYIAAGASPAASAAPATSDATQLPAHEGLRIGIVWQGNPDFPHDAQRSVADATVLAPLLAVPGTQWINLHYTGQPSLAGLHAAPGSLRDLGDTAALVAGLDLVVSVDTAVAHLAGALGVPCWLMLPAYMTDWRWMRERSDTPWYPSLQLFRQASPGDWASVVAQLVNRLQAPDATQAIRSLRRPQTSA